jgi:hypothetical protein
MKDADWIAVTPPARAIAIAPLQSDASGFNFKMGDALLILAHQRGFYRGFRAEKPDFIGISPATHVLCDDVASDSPPDLDNLPPPPLILPPTPPPFADVDAHSESHVKSSVMARVEALRMRGLMVRFDLHTYVLI